MGADVRQRPFAAGTGAGVCAWHRRRVHGGRCSPKTICCRDRRWRMCMASPQSTWGQMFAKDHLLPGPALAYVHGIAARVKNNLDHDRLCMYLNKYKVAERLA